MRKSVAKAIAKQRAEERRVPDPNSRAMRSGLKSARKARKQMIEDTLGDIPIR